MRPLDFLRINSSERAIIPDLLRSHGNELIQGLVAEGSADYRKMLVVVNVHDIVNLGESYISSAKLSAV